jgi:hypothetical protein
MISAFGITHIHKAGNLVEHLATSAKLGKAGRLKRLQQAGALHRAGGGKLEESITRPVLPGKKRKAYDAGFHG